MKCLILLFIIACGKLEMPGYRDLRDQDGDQIQNSDELSTSDRHLANYEIPDLGKIHLDVFQGTSSPMKTELELTQALKHDSFIWGLLFHGRSDYAEKFPIAELTHLHTSQNFPEFSAESQETPVLFLNFEIEAKNKLEVFLAHTEKDISLPLGALKRKMKLSLSKEQTRCLFLKKCFLELRESHGSSIFNPQFQSHLISKTRKIYLLKDGQAQLHFINRELALSEALELLGISEANDLSQENLLSSAHPVDLPSWWWRSGPNDSWFLIYSDLRTISQTMQDHHLKRYHQIGRENGFAQGTYKLVKKSSERSFLRFKAIKNQGQYSETVTHYRTGGGGRDGDPGKCQDFHRNISNSENQSVTTAELLEQLEFSTTGSEPSRQWEFIQIQEQAQIYWELTIPEGISEVNIKFKNLPDSAYFPSGFYASTCKHPNPVRRTQENYFKLDITHLVENFFK